jgi:2,3-bisphosphoglycerate-independent phosphoglycerate mutase
MKSVGVLENLGLDVELQKGDLAVRGNFCTVKEENGYLIVTDRRAGRIPTEENKKLCEKLQKDIVEIGDIKVLFTPGMEHRLAIRLRGEGLAGCVEDTDPQHEGMKPISPKANCPQGEKTVKVMKELLARVRKVLMDEERANFILLRGISEVPLIPHMDELFKLEPAAIATYPMYRGLAKLVGMELLPVEGMELESELEALKKHWSDYTFFYFHVKKTDSYGEDGNFQAKKEVIEKFDQLLPRLLDLTPQVLVITGDHSTPSRLKGHSWHPNPFLLFSPYVRHSGSQTFTEKACAGGSLGHFKAVDALPLMMAHALKLRKFGA